MSEVKRSRAANFTNSEKNLLVEIISQFKVIIENKKTDHKSVKQKEEAWRKIKNIYFAVSGIDRSVICLKTCWDNLKRKSRSTLTELKPDLTQTCFMKLQFDSTEDLLTARVKEILNESSDTLQNANDCEPACEEDISDFILSIKSYFLPDNAQETAASHLIKLNSVYSVQKENSSKNENDLQHNENFNEDITETETPIENKRRKLDFTPSNSTSVIAQQKFWEEKRSFISLAKEFLIAEEERKKEIHKLEIEERKLKIEILKLQIKI